VQTIGLANLYANLFEIGTAGDFYQEPVMVSQIIEDSGIQWNDVAALYSTVDQEVEKAQVFLEVAK
jgi:hypothetical protein